MAKSKKRPTKGRVTRMRAREAATNLHQQAQQATSQQRAATFTQQYRRWMLRRIAGFTLAGLGAVMVLVHAFMHLGNIQILPMQDLLIGYPAGAVLVVAGLMVGSRK